MNIPDRDTTMQLVSGAGITTKTTDAKNASTFFIVPQAHSYVEWRKNGVYVGARASVAGDQYGKLYPVQTTEQLIEVLRARIGSTPVASPKPAQPVQPTQPVSAPTATQQEVEPVAWSEETEIKQLEQQLLAIQEQIRAAKEKPKSVTVTLADLQKVVEEEANKMALNVLKRAPEYTH